MYVDILISPIYGVLLNDLVFHVCPPKKEKGKNEGRKRPITGPLNPLEVTSAGGGRDLQQCREVQKQWPMTSLLASLC